MLRKRPCRICRRWFVPHPRAGDRQRVCGAVGCQRERHRRACAAWRARESEAERRHRLRQRVRSARPPQGQSDPARSVVRWDVVRDAVGLEVAVILEEMLSVLEDVVRDAVSGQASGITGESRREMRSGRRDDMAGAAAAT